LTEDSRKIRSNTDGRDDRGRFGTGNPGRPRGARNRVSAVAEAVIEDNLGAVAEKCVQLAKEGNVPCVLALLRLRIPVLREGSVREPIKLPSLETPKDALAALRIIAEALARADIDDGHARSLVAAIEGFLKILEVVDHEERIRALEAAHAREDRNEAA
jgi:hypothetical protein